MKDFGDYRGVKHHRYKHGYAGTSDGPPTKIYAIWACMLRRCNSPKHASYSRYGGRGIRVCERWHTFENFLADMGDKPPGYSLDRLDNDGDYCPENCRWATQIEQARNTSTTSWATINDERRPVAEWCEIYGVNRSTVGHRVRRGGWSVERAITTPVNPR